MNIKIFLPLLKKSAKKSFQLLRNRAPLTCSALKCNVTVTKFFYGHIAHASKRRRNIEDLIERLLIIPFIDEILLHGKLVETRDKDEAVYFRITKSFVYNKYSVIVIKRGCYYHLLSCFIDQAQQKEGPS